ncbi:MAG: DNA polymerase III subunit delta [Cyanobacteria bacterium P01_H01_bin.74]
MPVHLYCGDDSFLLQRALKKLRHATLNPALGNLGANLGHKVLQSPSVQDALEAINGVYLSLASTTLIEIHHFPYLNKAAAGQSEQKQLDQLMDSIVHVDDSKCLVFVESKINKTVKFGKWLFKQVDAQHNVQIFNTLNFWQTSEALERVLKICQEEAIAVEPKAVSLLVERYGVATHQILNELKKLSIYEGNQKITASTVEQFVGGYDNFFTMLTQWGLQQKRAENIAALNELLLTMHPVQLLAMSQAWLLHLFQVTYWHERGISADESAKRLKKHPYKVKKDVALGQRITLPRLFKMRAALVEQEHQVKSGKLDGRLALEILMCS